MSNERALLDWLALVNSPVVPIPRLMDDVRTNADVIAEQPDMTEQERARRLDALWRRLHDPDGLDWETLEHVEQLTEPSQ